MATGDQLPPQTLYDQRLANLKQRLINDGYIQIEITGALDNNNVQDFVRFVNDQQLVYNAAVDWITAWRKTNKSGDSQVI